jgi:hypothetical protein
MALHGLPTASGNVCPPEGKNGHARKRAAMTAEVAPIYERPAFASSSHLHVP